MKLINLFAGPGAGKSTTAARVFYELKMKGLNAELVLEYAKDLTWEKRYNTLGNQPYVLGKQWQRIYRVKDQVDYIVTDSPILLGIYYDCNRTPGLEEMILGLHHSLLNINFFIQRVKPYNPAGRNQDENEAKAIDTQIKELLRRNHIRVTNIFGDETGWQKILETVL